MGRVARGVSFVFVSQVVRMAAKGALILLLTRYLLTPTEYGLLFLTLSVLGLALLFASLGLGKAGARYVTEYRETDPDLVPVVIRTTVRYRVLAILGTVLALVVFHRTIASAVGAPTIGMLLVIGSGYVAAKSLTGTATMLFQGFNRMDLTAVLSIVANALLIVLVPGLVLLGLGLEGALWGYVLSYAVAAAVGLGIVYSRFYSAVSVAADVRRSVGRRVRRYAVPLTFTMSANVLNARIDTILISVFRGPAAVAYYTVGKQVVDFLIAPAHSLGFGISPTVGEQKAADDLDLAAGLYGRSLRYTLALYAPAAAGVVLVADPAVRLVFGESYAPTVAVLQVFSLFVVVRAIDAITSDALDYLGRARSRAIAKGVLAAGNVGLNVLLIPPYGIVGATVATVLTQSVYVAAELYIIADELPLDRAALGRTTLLVGGITVAMAAVVYPLVGMVSGLATLAAVIATGAVVWFLLTAVTGVVDFRTVTTALRT